MAGRKTSAILMVLACCLFVGYVVYTSLGLDKVSCEVCVEFRGETACRTASGTTREEAVRTATENACAQLVSGMTDSMDCGRTVPKSINCQDQ